MEIIIVISLIFLFIGAIYVHKKRIRKNRIKVCVQSFFKYPLYTRQIISCYNKQNKTKVFSTIIENYKMAVPEKKIENELPSDLIKRLSNIDFDNGKNVEIENKLSMVLDLHKNYPRAISIVLNYSSSSMHRYSINKPCPIDNIFKLDERELLYRSFEEGKLQAIEKSIDNINYLNNHLYDLNPIKPEAESIIKLLSDHSQEYLYHFTHKDNLRQIKEMGGLYSWVKLEEMGKPCQHPGGNNLSRELDIKYGVADYVHLSFSFEHPMSYRNEKDIVILLIHPIVCLIPDTLFCNMNATDKNRSIGGSLNDLQSINMWATKMVYVGSGTRFFKAKQAEVLVKNFIPINYIVNIDYAS